MIHGRFYLVQEEIVAVGAYVIVDFDQINQWIKFPNQFPGSGGKIEAFAPSHGTVSHDKVATRFDTSLCLQ